MTAGEWADSENDVIVSDYFEMLSADESGSFYIKAEHNRSVQRLTGRTRPSIEFKYRNISAVLQGLGEDWILGYKPAFNFQASLAEAVVRWLARHPEWLNPTARGSVPSHRSGLSATKALYVGPPPTHSNQPPPAELDQMMALAQKFDVAARDARNRALGRAGEACAIEHEKAILVAAGRADLASKVRWVSEDDGDGAGFDIGSFDSEGRRRLIEVKTTNGWERTPFHVTRRELDVADDHRDEWILFRLWNFAREPRAFELRPPLTAHVALTPTSFQASFR